MTKTDYIISLIENSLDGITAYKDVFNQFISDLITSLFLVWLVKYDERDDELKYAFDGWMNYYIRVPLSAAGNVSYVNDKLYYRSAPQTLSPVLPADDDSTLTYKLGLSNLKRGDLHIFPVDVPVRFRNGRIQVRIDNKWRNYVKQGEYRVIGGKGFWYDSGKWKVHG